MFYNMASQNNLCALTIDTNIDGNLKHEYRLNTALAETQRTLDRYALNGATLNMHKFWEDVPPQGCPQILWTPRMLQEHHQQRIGTL